MSSWADIGIFIINIILLITVISAVANIRQNKKGRDAELLQFVTDQIQEVKADIRTTENMKGELPEPKDEEEAVNRASQRLQRVAYLAEKNLISKHHIIEMWGPTFVRFYFKAEPYIRKLRKEKGEPETAEDGAFSRKDLERFALKCDAYLARHYPSIFKATLLRTESRRGSQ